MLQFVRAARSRWEEASQSQMSKTAKESGKSAAAETRKATQHIKVLETKKVKLVSEVVAAAAH